MPTKVKRMSSALSNKNWKEPKRTVDFRHGTHNAYVRHRCRCRRCIAWYKADLKIRIPKYSSGQTFHTEIVADGTPDLFIIIGPIDREKFQQGQKVKARVTPEASRGK